MSTAFTGHEERWQARLGKLRDVVRQELVARQLTAELDHRPFGSSILAAVRGHRPSLWRGAGMR